MLSQFLASRLVKAGLMLLVAGSGPLLIVILASALGLTRDPSPNPIGLGILAVLTFWPSVLMIAVGSIRVLARGDAAAPRGRAPVTTSPDAPPANVTSASFLHMPISRAAIGTAGLFIVIAGAKALGVENSRGPAAAIVLGGACLWFAIAGTLPGWLVPRLPWRR